VPAKEEMSAARYRDLALPVIAEIVERGKLPLIVGGTGLYVKALTDGLIDSPPPQPEVRNELEKLSLAELLSRLTALDPAAAQTVDVKNRRRIIRAIEIALFRGQDCSRDLSVAGRTDNRRIKNRRSLTAEGVVVFRDRQELYQRINQRVERMLGDGAIEEVRSAGELSRSAGQMIGIKQLRNYLAGQISLAECTGQIQQATRRYAKRQLTWFRNQTNFESLNLSLLKHNEAVEWVLRRAVAWAPGDDRDTAEKHT